MLKDNQDISIFVMQELPILHFHRDPSAINKGIGRVEGAIKKESSFAGLIAEIEQNIERQKTNIDKLVKSLKSASFVIPAKAGIQYFQ